MTTDFESERVSIWPNEVASQKDGRITFKALDDTVAKVFSGKGVGLRFREDDTVSGEYTGAIWDIQGPFNDMANKRDPYTGPVPNEGQVINVTLSARKGDSKMFRDCQINTALAAPAAAESAQPPAETAAVQQEAAEREWGPANTYPKDVQISAQAFANRMVNLYGTPLWDEMPPSMRDTWLKAFIEIQHGSIPLPLRKLLVVRQADESDEEAGDA